MSRFGACCSLKIRRLGLRNRHRRGPRCHSCQPSRNGRDNPGGLYLVPAVSRSRRNSVNVPEFFVGGTNANLPRIARSVYPRSLIHCWSNGHEIIDNCCLDIELTHELLRECKKATMNTLRAPPRNLNPLLSRESACAIALLIGVVAC